MKRPGRIRAVLLAACEVATVLLIFGTAWGVLLIGHGLGYN